MAFKDVKRCKAKAKTTGEQCKGPCVKGYDVCRMHGANPKNKGGNPKIRELNERLGPIRKITMKGNTRGVKSGAWSRELLTEREKEIYDWFWDGVLEDNPQHKGNVTALALLNELAFSIAKVYVANKAGSDSARSLHTGRMTSLMKHLNIRPDVLKQEQRSDNLISYIQEGLNRVRPLPERDQKQLSEPVKAIDVEVIGDDEREKLQITNTNGDKVENEGT